MPATLERNIFTETVFPLIGSAKDSGASANALTTSFLQAMMVHYGDADLKASLTSVGFFRVLNAEQGSVSAKEAAKLYGGPLDFSEESVRKAARLKQLLALRDGNGNLHFPVWQFGPRGGTHPGFKEVLEILSRREGADDLAMATFFLNPTARLEDRSPLEVLRKGGEDAIEQVKQLARETLE